MAVIFKLAWRSVLRNKRRSIITLSAVAVGIASFVMMEGLLAAFAHQSEANLKRLDTAHIKVFLEGYWADRFKEPLKHRLSAYHKLKALVEGMDEVEGITERVVFRSKIYDGKSEFTCTAIGISLTGSDSTVFDLKDYVVKGEFIEEGEETLIGTSLADLFEVGPNDYLTIEFKDKNGVYDAAMLRIAGVLNTGHPEIDGSVIYLPFDFISERLALKDEATELAIKLKNERKMKKFKEKLSSFISSSTNYNHPLEILTWKEQAEEFIAVNSMKWIGTGILLGVLGIIIIVGILNTMLMSVYERFKEIGTLRALGMKAKSVRNIFLAEGAIIGGFGAVIGSLLGLIFMIIFSSSGIDIGSMYGDTDIGYVVKDYVYGSIRLAPFVLAFVIGISIAVLASYLPARRASRLSPVEALRHY